MNPLPNTREGKIKAAALAILMAIATGVTQGVINNFHADNVEQFWQNYITGLVRHGCK